MSMGMGMGSAGGGLTPGTPGTMEAFEEAHQVPDGAYELGAAAARGMAPFPTDLDAPPAEAKARKPVMELVGPVVVFALFLGFWYFMSYVGMSENRRFLVPPPHRVIDKSFIDWGNFRPMLEALWLSTKVALTGLAIAIVLGMAIAIAMSQARWVERSLYPYAVALQAVPILAFVPLIGVILGFNFRSRVTVCVIICLFPIIANTLFGLLSAERSQHELFSLHNVSRYTRLTRLQLPAAMPSIFNGFRISAGLAVIGAVVGDFFFRQGQPGIGVLIDIYRARLRNPEMFGAVILAALLGIVVFWIFGILSNRVVGKWYETTRKGPV